MAGQQPPKRRRQNQERLAGRLENVAAQMKELQTVAAPAPAAATAPQPAPEQPPPPALIGPIRGTPVRNPLDALSALSGQVEAWVRICENHLARLESMGDGTGAMRPEIRAFNLAARTLGSLLGQMARLDLDERLARVDAAQAAQLRDLVDAVVRDPGLGLSDAQRAEWPRAFARAVRARLGPMALEAGPGLGEEGAA